MPVVNETNAWVEIPGYDLQSRERFCSVTGSARKGDRVFRGPLIEFEGYFDISEQSARQLAGLIGFVPSDEADNLRDAIADVYDDLNAMAKERDSLREQVRAQTIQNAELYAQLALLDGQDGAEFHEPSDEGEEAAAEEGDEDDYVWDDPEFIPLDPDAIEGEDETEPGFDIESYLAKGAEQ